MRAEIKPAFCAVAPNTPVRALEKPSRYPAFEKLTACSVFAALLAQMRQSVAQWSAGNLNQSLERRVHLEDQEDRT